MMGTLASLALAYVDARGSGHDMPRNEGEVTEYLGKLESFGMTDEEKIHLFEGHLNILDQKNTAMLAFSVNYFLLAGFLFTNTNFLRNSLVFDLFGLGGVGLALMGLFLSFNQLIRVKWQDYTDGSGMTLRNLIKIKAERTRRFRRLRSIYILSIGLLFDYAMLKLALNWEPLNSLIMANLPGTA